MRAHHFVVFFTSEVTQIVLRGYDNGVHAYEVSCTARIGNPRFWWSSLGHKKHLALFGIVLLIPLVLDLTLAMVMPSRGHLTATSKQLMQPKQFEQLKQLKQLEQPKQLMHRRKLRTTGAAPTKHTKTVWKPALVTSWQWMIDHTLNINDPLDMGLEDLTGRKLNFPPPSVYDIDWESNSAKTVKALHVMNKKVICYVDVGAYENYRPDARKFPKSVIGKPDGHWESSYWLDIRRLDVLLPIMRARFQVCKSKGFDAIEPDEVDGYANDSGFSLSYADQLKYNRSIAALAHSMGLSVGLKGDIEQVPDLWRQFDWTLNEQCFEFDECGALSTYFVANGKAVFTVEYDDPYSGHRAKTSEFCPQANLANFNSMKMPLKLNGGRWPCR